MNYENALEILQLKQNYTIEDLRKQYKYFSFHRQSSSNIFTD